MQPDNSSKGNHYPNQKAFNNIVFFLIASCAFFSFGMAVRGFIGDHWFTLSDLVKYLLAVVPGILAGGLYVYVLLKKGHSKSWKESGALFIVVLVAFSLFNFQRISSAFGGQEAFLLTLTLISLLCCISFKSGFAAVATWGFLFLFFNAAMDTHWIYNIVTLKGIYLVLFSLSLWATLRMLTPEKVSMKGIMAMWAMALTVPFSFMTLCSHMHLLVMALFLSCSYLLGKLYLSNGKSIWTRPLQSVAAVSIAGYSIMLTSSLAVVRPVVDSYSSLASTALAFVGDNNRVITLYNKFLGFSQNSFFTSTPEVIFDYILALALIASIVLLIKRNKGQQISLNPFMVYFPAWIFFSMILGIESIGWYTLSWLVILCFYLFLSFNYIFSGINNTLLSQVAVGFILLIIFLVTRFIDLDVSNVWKAILYFLAGLSFLFFRYLYKMKVTEDEEQLITDE